MKRGDQVAWIRTAGGEPCAPKPCVVMDVRKAQYSHLVKGEKFCVWVPVEELQ